jgi:putative flippase GtrA
MSSSSCFSEQHGCFSDNEGQCENASSTAMLKIIARLRSLVIGVPSGVFVELLRYAVVGGVAAVVDFGLLVLFVECLGLHYEVAAVPAFIGGLTTNYLLSIRWVFQNRRLKNIGAEFTLFCLVGVLGLGWTLVIMYIGTDVLGIPYQVSKLAAIVLVFLWNFVARKVLLFAGGKHLAPPEALNGKTY